MNKNDFEIAQTLIYEQGKLQENINACVVFKKISEGCENILQDDSIHDDAKKLAKLIIKDCNNFIYGDSK